MGTWSRAGAAAQDLPSTSSGIVLDNRSDPREGYWLGILEPPWQAALGPNGWAKATTASRMGRSKTVVQHL